MTDVVSFDDCNCFTIWVTCMLSDYEEGVVLGLVKKGYIVSSADSKKMTLGTKRNLAVVIAVNVITTSAEPSAETVHADALEILKENKYIYYSLIVSPLDKACWTTTEWSWSKPKPIPDRNMN